MGSQLGKMQNRMISPFAFHAPTEPTYGRNEEHLTYIHTINNDRIAVSLAMHDGGVNPDWEPGKYGDRKQDVVVYCHGNAVDIGGCRDEIKSLCSKMNVNVFTFDYANYGRSEHTETTQKNIEDAVCAVYEHVTRHLGVPNNRIILMGKSLGTAPAVFLAAKDFMDDILGVVLISPLASGVRAIVPKAIVKSRMLEYLDSVFCPSLQIIQHIRVPVFIVHGKQDDIIPIQNAELLVAHLHPKAYYPPLYLHGQHNNLESNNPILFRDQMLAFIKSCKVRQQADADVRCLYD